MPRSPDPETFDDAGIAQWTKRYIADLSGCHVCVTGGNAGIGLATVRALCRAGAWVTLAARDLARGAAVMETLSREKYAGAVRLLQLDLASLASIRRFAGELQTLDVLVNNAGVRALPTFMFTDDAFEMQFGVNHLGHFALTGLLLPMLLRSSAPRVVTVSSLAHHLGKIDFDNLQSERGYTPLGAYRTSKLANLLFAVGLRDRYAGRIRSLAVHPGISDTNMNRTGQRPSSAPSRTASSQMQSAAMGALPTVLAVAGRVPEDIDYIGPGRSGEKTGYPAPAAMSNCARDRRTASRLWLASENLTGVVYLRLPR